MQVKVGVAYGRGYHEQFFFFFFCSVVDLSIANIDSLSRYSKFCFVTKHMWILCDKTGPRIWN